MSNDSTIPALSIRQPWVWGILNAGKRCENREWDPNGGNVAHARRHVGKTILIHGGKGCTRDEYESACFAIDLTRREDGMPDVPPLADLPRGFLLARATLADVTRTNALGHRVRLGGGIVCLRCNGDARAIAECACPKPDPWAIPGCIGLILADVVPLAKPVPYKGALGFFNVPASLVGGAS